MATKSYVVTFKESATSEQIGAVKSEVVSNGGVITQDYNMPGMVGFAAQIPDALYSSLQSMQGGIIDAIEEA